MRVIRILVKHVLQCELLKVIYVKGAFICFYLTSVLYRNSSRPTAGSSGGSSLRQTGIEPGFDATALTTSYPLPKLQCERQASSSCASSSFSVRPAECKRHDVSQESVCVCPPPPEICLPPPPSINMLFTWNLWRPLPCGGLCHREVTRLHQITVTPLTTDRFQSL